MAVDRGPELAQEPLCRGAARHPGRRLARTGALEDVAHVGEPELLRANQVGVARPREVHLG